MRACVEQVKATNPMAPSITNFVTIDYVANAQLAVGGSAAMVYLPDEGEMLAGSAGMYLNMGTLMPVYEQTIPRTGRALAAAGTPWVLDPVGIGIGQLRTQLLQDLRDCRPGIIRCNASEAIALAQLWGLTADQRGEESGVRGVDSTDSVDSAQVAAVALARHTGGAVAVSGEVDLVTDGFRVARVRGGSPLLTLITGSGCSLGGVAAVYATAADPFAAALTATVAYDLAADRAAEQAQAPGSFKVAFLDALYLGTAEEISSYPFELEVLA
ncbi:MAG: hydroxyethylthiazole kinase [Coriobacteriia bacterium]|nr:hydroxyethylthiazole kinase [Coriobacteriia bacterium]